MVSDEMEGYNDQAEPSLAQGAGPQGMMRVTGWGGRVGCLWEKGLIIDTENYRDLQENYRAYNFVSELEIRAVGVLSRPYNQGTNGRCAGMARRPLTV